MASRLKEEAPAAAAADENENEISRSSEDQKSEKTWQKSDREFLLVVVTFVATVAFQAGMNPPGGVWQDDSDPRYEAGKSIMATKHPSQFITFIVGVTVCMVVSLVQVVVLINELPYKRLSVSRNFLYATLCFAIAGMAPAYWSSVTALTPQPLMKTVTTTLASNLGTAVVVLVILVYIQKSRYRDG